MFDDCNGKPIYFCKAKEIKNMNLVNNDTQTSFEDEVCDEEIQVIERDDNATQTNYKEMMVKDDLNVDEKKLEQFFNKVSKCDILLILLMRLYCCVFVFYS